MISPDLRIEGFDARSWTNLVSLFAPRVRRRTERAPRESDDPELDLAELGGDLEGGVDDRGDGGDGGDDEPALLEGSLFLVVSARGRVRKAFHTTRGRTKGVRYDGPLDLERLASEASARRAVAIREGALEEIAGKIERRAAPSDDYVTSWLNVARAFREALDDGSIHVWPKPQLAIPVPSAAMVRRALDLVLPDETAMTLAVFEGGGLWTAAALRRRGGDIDWIAGPDLIAKWAGELGGDWRRDHRAVSEAVARHVAPVHFGVFAEAHTLEELLRSRKPGAWAAAAATREVIVQPTPPYVAVALGADAMRAMAKRTADALGGLDALSLLAPLARAVRGRVGDIASMTATLGFDPLKLLAGWLERSDPRGDPEAADDAGETGDEPDESEGDTPRTAARGPRDAKEGDQPPSGRDGVRRTKRRIYEEDDEQGEHESAFTAEVLPFPGVHLRSSAPPPPSPLPAPTPVAVPSDDEDDGDDHDAGPSDRLAGDGAEDPSDEE